jgi:hypothetical protein
LARGIWRGEFGEGNLARGIWRGEFGEGSLGSLALSQHSSYKGRDKYHLYVYRSTNALALSTVSQH